MEKKNNCRVSGIYCIINILNNKKYIGSSRNIYSRWYKHRANLRGGYHPDSYLQNAWDKYGEENFYFIILKKCPEHLAKLPQNQKGYKCPKRQKGVYIYDLDMNFVNKYNTLKEAAEFIGVAFQVISYTVLKSKSYKCKNYYVFREEQNRQEESTEGNS